MFFIVITSRFRQQICSSPLCDWFSIIASITFYSNLATGISGWGVVKVLLRGNCVTAKWVAEVRFRYVCEETLTLSGGWTMGATEVLIAFQFWSLSAQSEALVFGLHFCRTSLTDACTSEDRITNTWSLKENVWMSHTFVWKSTAAAFPRDRGHEHYMEGAFVQLRWIIFVRTVMHCHPRIYWPHFFPISRWLFMSPFLKSRYGQVLPFCQAAVLHRSTGNGAPGPWFLLLLYLIQGYKFVK